MYQEQTITHDGISIRIEQYQFIQANEIITKFQAFYEDYALTEIDSNKSLVILRAIAFINANRSQFSSVRKGA